MQTLLDYVCAFLPSPLDTENVIGTNPETGAEEDRKPSEDEDVYKRQYPYTADADITDGAGGKKEGTIAFEATDQSLAGQAKFDFLFADKDGAVSYTHLRCV